MGYWRRVRIGVTTLRANAREAEQQPRARCQRLNRLGSALTLKVNCVEAEKVKIHMDLLMNPSSQLRNLGSRHPVLPIAQALVSLAFHIIWLRRLPGGGPTVG